MSSGNLQIQMYLLIGAMFAIIYAVIVMIGTAMGMQSFYTYFLIALGMMWIQYMVGPKMIEWTMQLKYINREEDPKLYGMIEEQARRANIPMPKVAVAATSVPNAFAFGRGIKDGRVCVSNGIMQLLNDDELRAVIGHELTHIKNRDVLTITLLSVIPMIMYRIAWHFMFYGGGRRDDRGGNGAMVGLAALVFYFISNLLVLYGSRIREYYADRGSVELGNKPAALASALYKLVYGSARMADTAEMKEVEGMKAFFLNDPSKALNEIHELKELDMNKDGTIDTNELFRLRGKTVKIETGHSIMEMMSTHPNMLKRIKHLAELKAA
jgi:heat shock protein HtpX